MELLKTDSLLEAREKLRQATVGFPLETEELPLEQALSSICGEDIVATENVPPFRRSTVDGYAVMAEDTYGAGESNPVFFGVTGRVSIEEEAAVALHPGEAVQVQTGSMIPHNATAVLMLEYTECYAPGKLAAYRAVSQGENMTAIGEDMKAGACVIPRGTCLGPAHLGILASMGRTHVNVFKPLAVTVISTGDELVGPDEIPKGAQIRDMNSYVLAALARKQGMQVVRQLCMKDDEAAIFQAVQKAVLDSDLVILSGGSSKGEKDYTKAVFTRTAGGILTHGIAIKPGKPTVVACDRERRTVLVGLPGHPLAAALVFHLLIGHWQDQRTGRKRTLPYPAVIKENVSSNQGRETCLLVRLTVGEEGYEAWPVYAKSGSISCLGEADGYTLIDRSREGLRRGERIWVERLE